LLDQDTEGSTKSEWILKKCDVRTHSSGSGPGYGIKLCTHGNPTPGFINKRFFNEPNDLKPQF